MARQPKPDAPGTLHPLVGRGIEGPKIFEADPGGGISLPASESCARKVFLQYMPVLKGGNLFCQLVEGKKKHATGPEEFAEHAGSWVGAVFLSIVYRG